MGRVDADTWPNAAGLRPASVQTFRIIARRLLVHVGRAAALVGGGSAINRNFGAVCTVDADDIRLKDGKLQAIGQAQSQGDLSWVEKLTYQ